MRLDHVLPGQPLVEMIKIDTVGNTEIANTRSA